MKIDVLTLFPDMFQGVFTSSMLGKAADKGLVAFQTINFRDYAGNKHQTVDDTPYGGGVGMVLKPEPLFRAVREHRGPANPRVILMCPQGRKYDQQLAEELAQESHLMLVCGHYEGFDERIREHLVTDEISIGDYILTGGEIAAMAVVDSVVRLLPGVLGNEQSSADDSFSAGRLEYPQYTRPAVFEEHAVPEVLLSGHHANIETWRKKMSLWKTLNQRPDLLERVLPDREEEKWLQQWRDSGHFS